VAPIFASRYDTEKVSPLSSAPRSTLLEPAGMVTDEGSLLVTLMPEEQLHPIDLLKGAARPSATLVRHVCLRTFLYLDRNAQEHYSFTLTSRDTKSQHTRCRVDTFARLCVILAALPVRRTTIGYAPLCCVTSLQPYCNRVGTD
jgi:hypothetical protein